MLCNKSNPKALSLVLLWENVLKSPTRTPSNTATIRQEGEWRHFALFYSFTDFCHRTFLYCVKLKYLICAVYFQ